MKVTKLNNINTILLILTKIIKYMYYYYFYLIRRSTQRPITSIVPLLSSMLYNQYIFFMNSLIFSRLMDAYLLNNII